MDRENEIKLQNHGFLRKTYQLKIRKILQKIPGVRMFLGILIYAIEHAFSKDTGVFREQSATLQKQQDAR